ncbi:MAG: hypothetical protein ACYDBJ_10530 [Aggregatilineales bacterium]
MRTDLIEQLEEIARQEHRSVDDLLASMIGRYRSSAGSTGKINIADDIDTQIRQDRLRTYERARSYWRSIGDMKRSALTDTQLDEQFWLIGPDGVPRLQADRTSMMTPFNPLSLLAKAAAQDGLLTEPIDIAARSREILNNEFADYLTARRDLP